MALRSGVLAGAYSCWLAGRRALAIALCAVALALPSFDDRAEAQGVKAKRSTAVGGARAKADPNAKMLVNADEIVYDYQKEQVSAVGHVQIYYDGAVLEADRVTHDRKTNRLHAHGNVRYKAKDGNVLYGEQLELDAQFRDGFIQSFLVETPQRTRFAAARADRREGNITEMHSGIYTACEPCKEDPKKPPVWQVKAARVIHNEGEKVVYYENATVEFFGVPIAYFPVFWHPDPTVKRRSGFLVPTTTSHSRTGIGIEIPYYFALAPNYDFTFSMTPFTKQHIPLLKGEWRHLTENGGYVFRASGIFQTDPNAFRQNPDPFSPRDLSFGDRDFRGSIETQGQFRINPRWVWGWDGTLVTDRAYFTDYQTRFQGSQPVGLNEGGYGSYNSERTSKVYLTGQGDRSYFDVRAMHFYGLSRLDVQDQIPVIHPVLDYSYVFGKPIFGGELALRTNFVSMTREQTDFAAASNTSFQNAQQTTLAPGTPKPTSPGPLPNCDISRFGFDPGAANCFVRGFAGDYTRMSTELSWKRSIITPGGLVFKPFANARVDLASRDVNGVSGVVMDDYAALGRENLARGMATVGFDARYPMISVHSWGTQILEPIVQVVARNNESNIGRFPNEDAQSLIFDDTNLFSIDKYSGYDRVEGGGRANVGVSYTANINRYGMINVLFGQSYHLFGRNSFAFSGQTDVIDGNTVQVGYGLQSGLENNVSDYVGRIYFQPTGNISFTTRARFDKDTFDIKRFEFETKSTFDRLQLSTIYGFYEQQPLIGYTQRREGIFQTASLKLSDTWGVFGGARYDIDAHRFDMGVAGVSYLDECFAANLMYVADYSNLTYTKPVHRVMLRVNLRTIGGTGVSTSIGDERTN
jgi:LPS-assembly protein